MIIQYKTVIERRAEEEKQWNRYRRHTSFSKKASEMLQERWWVENNTNSNNN